MKDAFAHYIVNKLTQIRLSDTIFASDLHKKCAGKKRNIMKKVTIQDIADALGVSRNTVSKAINNSDGLAEATREKILQKAVEMGYKQFSYINALTNISTPLPKEPQEPAGFAGEIALLTTQFFSQSHFASPLLDQFQREISYFRYTLNAHRVMSDNIKNLTLPLTFSRERVRAIVCIEMFDRAYDEMICKLGIPVLFIDGPVKRDGVSLPADQLYMDNTTEITRLVLDMLKRGKRRIGFIGDYDHCQSFFERYTAFRTAMLLAGETVDETYVIKGLNYGDLYDPVTSLKELPDVFLCANDFIAADVLLALKSQGLSVPDDVSLVGFDDSPEARILTPTLTTIHIHPQIMAFSAMHLLMSRIKEPSLDFRTVYTQTDLVYRESTAD